MGILNIIMKKNINFIIPFTTFIERINMVIKHGYGYQDMGANQIIVIIVKRLIGVGFDFGN